MNRPAEREDAAALFAGDGEVRALARELDWGATPLGPVAGWPGTLRSAVRMCMDSPFPINLWCGDELVLIYNDAYTRVLGPKHPAALGRRGQEVWSEIWPEIGPLFGGIRSGGPAAYAEDAPFVIVREGDTAANGAAEPNAWFTFSLSAIREPSGEIAGYLNIVSESTGRIMAERAREAALVKAERAEARLRDVFSQAPAFMAVLNGEDLVFEYANAAYYQLVGHRELIGRPLWEALPEVRGQGFEDLLANVLATGEPFIGREIPVVVTPTPGGEPGRKFVDLVYYPIVDETGVPSGVVAHGSDVTDHVLARRDAQRAREEAEHANQAKSHFLANMSHEIRTPINAVVGYTDLLDAGVAGSLSERQQEYVERIRASSKHLLGLVNDVLDLAKIEAGEMAITRRECAPAGPVDQALEMVAQQAEARELELVREWSCPDDVRMMGDEDRIRQILLNLLSNAMKFTDPGGTITVRCRMAGSRPAEGTSLPEGGPWIVLEVEDTGRGMSKEQLTRIFAPFVQADTGHTRSSPGTGLGLTISRRLARLMGGELVARSEPGAGSTFEVWLASSDQVLAHPPGGDWGAMHPLPEDVESLPGLAEVADVMMAAADHIEVIFVERLRKEPALHAAGGLSRAQLADHTAPLLVIIAKALSAIEQGGASSSLLSDGQDFQEVVALGHGRQRRRFGWSRADLDREYELLHDVIDVFLRSDVPKRTASDIDGAISLVHRLLERARAATIAGYEHAG